MDYDIQEYGIRILKIYIIIEFSVQSIIYRNENVFLIEEFVDIILNCIIQE